MILKILFIILFGFSLLSCHSVEDDNEYFYTLNDEISTYHNDLQKRKQIYIRELQKYQDTKKDLFLMSSKFAQIRTFNGNRLLQIEAICRLLSLNNNKYPYITTNCNYYLASKFEKSLPRTALTYINNAIDADEKSIRKHQLPHLYHFKGRILYNEGSYSEAILLFNKALKIHKERDQPLYISSMHNNLGMCYQKIGDIQNAIKENITAIKILEEKADLSEEQRAFLNYTKGGLADYYIQILQYENAKKLLLEEWKYSLKAKDTELALNSAKGLIRINDLSNQIGIGDHEIIDSLKTLSRFIRKPEGKVEYNEILLDYYASTNDHNNYKNVSKQLINAINYRHKFHAEELERNFEFSDKTFIENFNKDFLLEKKKNDLLITVSILIVLTSLLIIVSLRINKKKKIDLLKKDMIIAESEKKNLAENVKFQDEKIKNFHLLLNLKTEAEKTFIESLKKIKKSKDIDAEEAIKDLLLRIKNIINLDSKSIDFVNESSDENSLFINKLSELFPVLTKNDLKFCIYFRLGLASKEISLLENITEASARVYKTKIKSKMKLSREINLTQYLQKI